MNCAETRSKEFRPGRLGEQVRLAPLDARRRVRVGVVRVPRGALQRDTGDVGPDHRPPGLGEPDGIGALAAAHIQRQARRPAGHLGDQLRVRVAAPDPPRRPVPLVPEVHAEHLIGIAIVLTHPLSITVAGDHRRPRCPSQPSIR